MWGFGSWLNWFIRGSHWITFSDWGEWVYPNLDRGRSRYL